jgi:hypothetical protein
VYIAKGEWKASIPNEVQLLMQDDKPDWDWQVREVNGIEWFVARIGTKAIAGMIAATVDAPPVLAPQNETTETEDADDTYD